MLSEKQVAQFQRDGFLNGGRILSDEELNELRAELKRILDIGPNGFSDSDPQPVLFQDLNAGQYEVKNSGEVSATPVWQIVNMWEASDAFKRLVHHPGIAKAISQLTAFSGLQIWHDQIQYKPAGDGGATSWHQDAPKWPSIEPMTPVSAWIPFEDADIENGCMWMVPGSYQWGDNDRYLDDKAAGLKEVDEFTQVGEDFQTPSGSEIQNVKAQPCPVKQGEVHFHHSLTWHGSPRNHSERPRPALAIHYMSSDAVYTGLDHLMVQFIQVKPGESMAKAGEHFPVVLQST